jgi:hypothetical protein
MSRGVMESRRVHVEVTRRLHQPIEVTRPDGIFGLGRTVFAILDRGDDGWRVSRVDMSSSKYMNVKGPFNRAYGFDLEQNPELRRIVEEIVAQVDQDVRAHEATLEKQS